MEKMNDFLVTLRNMIMTPSWAQRILDYCKANPIMIAIVGVLAAFILVVLCIILVKSRKAKKATTKTEPAPVATETKPVQTPKATQHVKQTEQPAPVEKPIENTTTPAPVEEVKQTTEPPTPVAVEKKEEKPQEPAPTKNEATMVAVKEEKTMNKPILSEEKTPVAEPAKTITQSAKQSIKTAVKKATESKPTPLPESTPTETPIVEEIPEPIVEETIIEEPPVAPPSTPKKSKRVHDVEEMLTAVENLDDEEDPLSSHYDEDETDKIARYKGKWVICRVLTNQENSEENYFFELHASNGEKLLTSEDYTSYQGAIRGIQTHKTNILNGNLKITLSKKGDYLFKLLSGKNMLLCLGENYPTKVACESAIASTVRFAATAILDENVQDIVVKVPKEDDTPLPPLPEGCVGKWIISSTVNADGESVYYFELFANNGEKLLSSEEYTTYIGAVNGIQTHKKNIEKDNFRITLTKRGDYIYKLLNGNDQLLCLGEHYKTKRLCQNAVDSVKRFSANSPVLTNIQR